MNYKVFLYIIMLFTTIFSISGINFTNFFKKNSEIQAKFFIMILALGLSYIATKFLFDFIELL